VIVWVAIFAAIAAGLGFATGVLSEAKRATKALSKNDREGDFWHG
jgi:hypothetical protein